MRSISGQARRDQAEAAGWGQRSLRAGVRDGAHRIQYDVVGLGARREVFSGIVNDPIGAERSDELDVGGAAHPGHLSPEVFRELDGRRTNRAGRTVDEHALPAADTRLARRNVRAVVPPNERQAASSKLRLAGFRATAPPFGIVLYSA